ncbi:MAG: alpha-amylase/4-alpha-glucanotransferase domain-containing protein [SAR324 cluster bacterium]
MKSALLFGVHGHQPVGNFESVITEAHEKCYRPFFRTLYRYPAFRFSVHFSGWLLEVLLKRFPGDLAVLKEMVGRGQVELFGSGHYEPVLSALPMADRIGQLKVNAEFLWREFGQQASGAWLTERVWEPGVVPALYAAGVRYITVDDYHFLCAGKTREEIDGYFLTEEGGDSLALFPISEQLRYHLPFTPAPEAVAFLEAGARNGRHAAVYFDDIEKFGIWPETWQWVYGKRWLETFVEAVLASSHVEPKTFREFHGSHASRGVIYLPTMSYAEMNEWTLPGAQAEAYTGLLHREQAGGHFDRTKPFIRGGIWRNFLSLYAESNWMHKRMLGLSRRLTRLRRSARSAALYRHLYAAQSNDAYWHGLFGGLYLPHLRRAVWNNLIALEAELDAIRPEGAVWRGDLDLDGVEELMLSGGELKLAIKLDGFGAIHELDARRLAHNFGDTLRRYPQAYFTRYIHAPAPGAAAPGIASAHDRLAVKHEIAPPDLEPDALGRSILVDFHVAADGGRAAVSCYELVSTPAADPEASFMAQLDGRRIEKRIRLQGQIVEASYRFSGAAHGRFEIELNLSMPSCDGYGGRYMLANGEIPCGFGQPLDLTGCTRLVLDDRVLAGGIVVETSAPVSVQGRPHLTVSQSEAGLEKIMQSACVTLSWIVPEPEADLRVTLRPYGDGAPEARFGAGRSLLRRWFAALAPRGARSSRT